MENETISCIHCSAQSMSVLDQPDIYKGIHPEVIHSVYYCAACDIYFASAIDSNDLMEYYPRAYYTDEGSSFLLRALSKLRVRNRAKSVEWKAHKGSALDIGCGRGTVLSELQGRGWSVFGTDWNGDNAKDVSQRLNIQVEGGEEAMKAFDDNYFDVLSLFHVLEHDENPVVLLKEAHRVLKPGGRLLVAVPNARSVARSVFKRYWFGYDLPRHRLIFTPRSLRKTLNDSGFNLDLLTGRFSDELLDIRGSLGLYFEARKIFIGSLHLPLAVLIMCLIFPARLLGYYSTMYAYAEKQQQP